jgi:hypothetical protein
MFAVADIALGGSAPRNRAKQETMRRAATNSARCISLPTDGTRASTQPRIENDPMPVNYFSGHLFPISTFFAARFGMDAVRGWQPNYQRTSRPAVP